MQKLERFMENCLPAECNKEAAELDMGQTMQVL